MTIEEIGLFVCCIVNGTNLFSLYSILIILFLSPLILRHKSLVFILKLDIYVTFVCNVHEDVSQPINDRSTILHIYTFQYTMNLSIVFDDLCAMFMS